VAINDLLLPDNTPVGEIPIAHQPVKPKREAPGFWRSAYEEFKELNTEINLVTGTVNRIQDITASFSDRPEGWKQYNVEAIRNHHPDDWGDILSGVSPIQQELIGHRRKEEREHREWLAEGGWVGKLAGGGLAYANPFSLANKIPFGSQFASASKSMSFVQSAARIAPGIGAQAAVVNASRLAAQDTMTLDNWFLDTARDTVFGSVFFGAMGVKQSWNINGRLKGMQKLYEDLDYVAKTTDEGQFIKWEAHATDKSVGSAEAIAARVAEAQKFIDNGLDSYAASPWFYKMFAASPVVKMMTSKSSAVREWGDKMFRSSNILKLKASTQEGEQSAEQLMKGFMGESYNCGRIMNNLWEEYAGINANLPFKDSLAAIKKKMGDPDFLGRTEFIEQVAYAFRRGDEHSIPKVAEAAKEVRKHYGNLYEEAVKLNLMPAGLDPITAISYLNRVYNKERLLIDGENFQQAVVEDLMKQSQTVNGIMAPINKLKEERESLLTVKRGLKTYHEEKLKETIPATKGAKLLREKSKAGKSYAETQKQIKLINEKIKAEQKRINDAILSKEIDPILVSERPKFTKKELEELETVRGPIQKTEKELNKPIKQTRTKLKQAKENLRVHEREFNKERGAFEPKKQRDQKLVELQHEVDTLEAELKSHKENLKAHKTKVQEELTELHLQEKLNKRLYNVTSKGFIKLVEPEAVPGLRKALELHEAKDYATRVYHTILNQNEEQMFEQAFGDATADGGTNPLKARTLLVRDSSIERWLDNDMAKLTNIYSGYMSKKIASEKVLQTMGTNGREGLEDIVSKINKEFVEKQATLQSQPQSKARDKKLLQLEKEKNKDIDLINKSWRAFWGNYNNEKYSEGFINFMDGLRNWTASISLGALPLMQMTDVAMLIRQYGIGPTLQEGLFPLIKGIFTGANKAARNDLAHGGLAINTHMASYSDQLYGHGSQYTKKGWIGKTLGIAAQKLGNITGSNQLQDAMQQMAGTISQSKTYAALKKFVEGKNLSKAEHERLHLLGLNKQEWAEKIVKQFDTHGSFVEHASGAKAQLANYHLWEDREAAQILLNSIMQEVDTVVLRANIADVPFCFRDPILSSMTMFMGYSFASTNHRLLNLLQRPTANAIMGEAIAMSIGAYIDPLREYLDGKEPDLSIEALMASAVTNGAPGGYFVDSFNRMNSVLDIPYLNKLRNDRFKGKGALKLLGGAPGTALEGLIRLMNTGINVASGGEASESDYKHAMKMIPWTRAWELRGATNAWIEAQNFPRQSKKADILLGE
jgi:hypothetical protein